MTLLAVERIKLFTTRSPWWCIVLAIVLPVGFAALLSGLARGNAEPISVTATQTGYAFGMVVVMVMAALSVTTEYRFGTMRTTFQAVPNRIAVLLAKTTVVALVAGVVGEIAAFASWALVRVIHPGPQLALNSEHAWRAVAGVGLVYLIAAVIALAVGILVRQSAGAISILLVYTLLVESLVTLIPTVGDKIHDWMPFNVADNFLSAGSSGGGRAAAAASGVSLGPWASLGYFAAIAAVLLVVALVTARRRDA